MKNTYIGYYSPTKTVGKDIQDISTKELIELENKRDFRQAVTTVTLVFGALLAFAIWASKNAGNVYI